MARKSRLRRAGLLLVAVLLCLVTCRTIIRTPMFQRWLGAAVVQVLEAATGERARVGKLRLEAWPPGARLEGLVLAEAETGATILAVREVKVSLGWSGAPIHELELVEPVLHLTMGEGGVQQLSGLPRGGRGGDRTPWRRLAISGGRVVLGAESGRLWVGGLDLEPMADPHTYRLSWEEIGLRHGKVEQVSGSGTLEPLTLDMGRLAFNRLDLRFPGFTVGGELALARGEAPDGDLSLDLDLSAWNPNLAPSQALHGEVFGRAVLGGTADAPTLGGLLVTSPWGLTLAPGDEDERLLSFGGMSCYWSADERGRAHLDDLVMQWADGDVGGTVELDLAHGAVSMDLHTRGVSLREAFRSLGVSEAPWVDLQADLEARLDGTWSPLSLDGMFQATALDFRVAGGPVDDHGDDLVLHLPAVLLAGSLDLDAERIRLDLDELAMDRTRGQAAVEIGLQRGGPLDIRVSLPRVDLSEFRPLGGIGLEGRGTLQAVVRGPFDDLGIHGQVDVEGLEVVGVPFAHEARVPVVASPLHLLRFPAFHARRGESFYSGDLSFDLKNHLAMEAHVLVREGRISDMAGMFVDLPGVDGRLSGILELAGEPKALDGTAEIALQDVELLGERFPSGHASARLQGGAFTLGSLVISRQAGTQGLMARGSVGPGYAANFEILSDGLRLEGMDALAGRGWELGGGLKIAASWRGTLTAPEFAGRVDLFDLDSRGAPVPPGRISFQSSGTTVRFGGRLLGHHVQLGATADWSTAGWSVEAMTQELPLHLAWPAMAGGEPLLGWLDGDVRLLGEGTRLERFNMQVPRLELRWGSLSLSTPRPWLLAMEGGHWATRGGGLVGEGSDLVLSGDITPERGYQLDLRGPLDLGWLALLDGYVERASGSVMVDAEARGPMGAPALTVDLGLSRGSLRTPYFPHVFEDLEGKVKLHGGGVELRGLGARVGGGTFTGEGWIHSQDWIPRTFGINVGLEGARIRYLDMLPPAVGSASLRFEGPTDALVLSGEVRIHDMVFSDRVDWERWVLALSEKRLTSTAPEETPDVFALDLQIKADRTGRVRNNMANAVLSADLRVVGDTARPGLLGYVRTAPGGRAWLEDRAFDITRAELRFVDPQGFDPDLDLLLEADVRSRLRDYRIFYRVTGPFSAWQASASSDPPLSQADINWLLLFGATREELEEYGGLEGAVAWEGVDILGHELGSLIGQELGLGEDIVQRLGGELARVEVVTGPSSRGLATVSSAPRLLVQRDLPGPLGVTVSGEFEFGADTFLSLEKRIARQLYLTGYWSSAQNDRALPMEGAFGTEFKLRWEWE